MSLKQLHRGRSSAPSSRNCRASAILRAVERPCLHVLEARRLLSTFTVTGSHSAVFLTAHGGRGQVDVRYDSDTSTPQATLTDSSDTISASSYSAFTFVNEVPAYYMPGGGISFHGGSGCTLK